MTYMAETELNPQSRNIRRLFDIMNTRYGKTDTEKSRFWLSRFADFKRMSGGNSEDFWSP